MQSPDDLQSLASFRRSGELVDLYKIWDANDILRIDAKGFWDIPAANLYAADIVRIVAQRRALRPSLRVIVDRSAAPRFDVGVPERLLSAYNQVLRSGDRVAIIVDSSLAKGQIRRVTDREETRSFLSISAATTWVQAYD